MLVSRTRLQTVALASRKGMSLVEIMVVIAIIGILMTVVAVNVVGYLDEANVSTTKIQIKNMESALTTYAAKHRGKYPSTGDGLDAAKKFFPNNDVPTDAWGNTFQYRSPGSSAPYEVISLGKDGKEGGEEANADINSATMSQTE
jgi:general secretion pathway protein G